MTAYAPQIAWHLDEFQQGDRDRAFFGLLEMGLDALPDLIAAFRAECDGSVRALLVEVIWQHREQAAIPFLGEALSDPFPEVWKQAIDGLVTLASPAALESLRSARARLFSGSHDVHECRSWLDEAIEQLSLPHDSHETQSKTS